MWRSSTLYVPSSRMSTGAKVSRLETQQLLDLHLCTRTTIMTVHVNPIMQAAPCQRRIISPLSRLFSLCYAKGRQPALWKTARVVPIHKKKSKAQPNNYRPISLLSSIPKVMEAIVNRTIVNLLEKEDLLSAHQFGFHRKLGTSDLLTLLQHELSSAFASHGAVYAIAIDIAGAFDKVAHRGVLAKA